MKSYSMDFRQRVAQEREEGAGTAEVAEMFNCSPAWVRRLMQRQRQRQRESGGSLAPKVRKPIDQRKIKEPERERLRRFIAEHPDATLAELIQELKLDVHPGTLSRNLRAMDLPLKKSPVMPPSRTGLMSKSSGPSGLRSSRR